ncbi:MAG: 3-phosphoserine/phosphohydroxythreonine transaminase [Helicobacter sp.]|nr:3-phosphoserine/phosphohydroxythreonine transaminase [Helicobacter sp.]
MESKRICNFNAGPSTLPESVLKITQESIFNYQNSGVGVLEISHRSDTFLQILEETKQNLIDLLKIPKDYKIIFMQGGARFQFATIPLNFCPQNESADYITTGYWSHCAFEEANKSNISLQSGAIKLAAGDKNLNTLPSSYNFSPNASYLHYTSNETISGIYLDLAHFIAKVPKNVPIFCDMSSDFLSREIDVSKYDLIYAGAQKNAGVAGVSIIILKESLLNKCRKNLPITLSYPDITAQNSLHNTPNIFGIYMLLEMTRWLKNLGGLSEIYKLNVKKSNLIYDAIEQSNGFYKGYATKNARGIMNIAFNLENAQLEADFIECAKKESLVGLKGHKALGGIRSSLYNALSLDCAQKLSDFMKSYVKR